MNLIEVKDYAEKCFLPLNDFGVKIIVFGSCDAKQVPKDFTMENAWEQLFKVGSVFSGAAEKHGQIIAV